MSPFLTLSQARRHPASAHVEPRLFDVLSRYPIAFCNMFGDVIPDKGFFVLNDGRIVCPIEVPSVAHDFAHVVEAPLSRLCLPDWGLKRFDTIADCSTKGAFAALSREVRTRAIQLHLSCFGCDDELKRSTTWSQLNNPFWMQLVKDKLPTSQRFRSIFDVTEWEHDLRMRTSKGWSFDRVVYELEQRIPMLLK